MNARLSPYTACILYSQPSHRTESNADRSLTDLQDWSFSLCGFLRFQRETDAVCSRAQRQSEQCVSVTHCDPRLLGGAVVSVHASTVPAACSDKSSPAVRGRALNKAAALLRTALSPSAVLASSPLYTGEELWATVLSLASNVYASRQ